LDDAVESLGGGGVGAPVLADRRGLTLADAGREEESKLVVR